MEAYPEIDSISRKVAIMEKAGYIPVATFILPEEYWTEHFYAPPLQRRNSYQRMQGTEWQKN